MLKKIAKGILLSLMCTFIFTGNAYAGKAFYVFSLGNTGTTINHFLQVLIIRLYRVIRGH